MSIEGDELVKDILEHPHKYELYGTGNIQHYESNKLLFDPSLVFLREQDFIEEYVPNMEHTVLILFTPMDDEVKQRILNTPYRCLELYQFIDYKAKVFWDNKGEYKGVDKNHYMSNEYVIKKMRGSNAELFSYIPTDKNISVLSLGCGTGNLERHLLSYPNVKKIDAFDISGDSIKTALDKIKGHERAEIVHYGVANLNVYPLKQNEYDLIIAQECVHHIQNLESLYENIELALKPEGVFLQAEYVGPNRFQFESSILYTVNFILKFLPEKFKIKNKYQRTTKYNIIQADPSEAVRAEDIIPLTRKYFPSTQIFFMSGTLMHILHQNLNMEYFYTENYEPKDNLNRSRILTQIVFFLENIFWGKRYAHLALLKSNKKQEWDK